MAKGKVPISRVAWTFAVIGIVVFASQIVLPGVNRAELTFLIDLSKRHGNPSLALAPLSVVALGIAPLISASVIVEVVALIVPRWRPLRHGGPQGRRVLGTAIAVVAIVLATVQGYFVVVSLEAWSATADNLYAGSRWLTIATLVGGTMALAWLVAVNGVRGIGNGYAVLLFVSCVSSVQWRDLAPTPLAGVIAIVAAVFVIAITALLVGSRSRRIPVPSSGILPLGDTPALAALFSILAIFGIWSDSMPKISAAFYGRGLGALAVLGFTLLWSYVFARPSVSRATRGEWWGATWLTMVALLCVFVVTRLGHYYVPEAASLLDPWKLMLATAIAIDLFDEIRARRRELVPVWPLHAPLRIQDVCDRLAAAGIEPHLQSRRLRSLLWFFGPYVPIMVLVPPDRAVDAERILRGLQAE
jgi:preprotein translocase subunit SecY